MSKLWVIVLGTAVAAVVAAGLYLNLTGADAGISPAMASESDALVVEVAANEHIIGDPAAPVTIVEYASLTCPHCAAFHTETLPEVKKQLLDTGKARLVYRDFPLDQLALRASALVRCAQPLQRPAMLSLLFQTQATWARAQDPMGALAQIGRGVGMSEAAANACLQDQTVLDAVIAQRLEAEQKYKVASTPSFIIGGKLYGGGLTVEQVVELVAKAKP
jgi:protein-disulfide isomerase